MSWLLLLLGVAAGTGGFLTFGTARLAIDKVEVVPAVVAPQGRIELRVTIRGTPGGHENELSCQIDNEPDLNRRISRTRTASLLWRLRR